MSLSSSSQSSSSLLPFVSAWKGFYEKAKVVVKSSPLDVTKLRSILETLTTLMSGVDEPKKASAVLHGALVLAVESIQRLLLEGTTSLFRISSNSTTAANSTTASSSSSSRKDVVSVWIIGLKAIQSCVVRNPAGRARCRHEGVFDVLSSILSAVQHTTTTTTTTTNAQNNNNNNNNNAGVLVDTEMILQETYVTLAAVCLGDDLNALKATMLYMEMVESALRLYPTCTYYASSSSSLHQTLTYLQALFRVMEKEQKDLLEKYCYFDNNNTNNPSTGLLLFETIETAETNMLEGMHKQRNNQWPEAEAAYSKVLNTSTSTSTSRIQSIMAHTKLLDDMVVSVLDNRSLVRLKLEDWNGALVDVHACLQLHHHHHHHKSSSTTKQRSPNRVVALLARRADALKELGRMHEAEEALEKALLISPRDKTLVHKRNRLQLAKSNNIKACKPSFCPKNNRRRRQRPTSEWNAVALESWLGRGAEQYAFLRATSQQQQQQQCTVAAKQFAAKPGTSVKSRYGSGIVQEVRKCGTTKIQLQSWSPGAQQPTAYLMPEFYTVVSE